jgi:hypothetical protein
VKKSKVNFAWYRLKMVSKIMLYSLEDESAELELIGKVDKGGAEQYSIAGVQRRRLGFRLVKCRI